MGFSEKIFRGEPVSVRDWTEYLKEAHRLSPSMTPDTFETMHTDQGENSYQVLCKKLLKLAPSASRILDLACGDGHLISIIDTLYTHPTDILGIDMSVEELKVAHAKNFKNRVKFKCEMANQISQASDSFDAITCHMAFMLMSPLHSVVNEVARLLKPGGVFLAVIDRPHLEIDQDFYAIFRKMMAAFLKERFPAFISPQIVDERLNSPDGIQRIMSVEKFTKLRTQDFVVSDHVKATEAWKIFKDFYFVSALPDKERGEFRFLLIAEAERAANPQGNIAFHFPMRLLTCEKI